MTENLFSYGTLQQEEVQLETFGRKLEGRAAILPGYKMSYIKIEDEEVVALSGKTHHPIIIRTENINNTVEGTVFKITLDELFHADAYEVASYKRISVLLQSGIDAWVYVDALQ